MNVQYKTGRVHGAMLLTSYIIKQILLSINKLVHNHMQWIKIQSVFIYVSCF